MGEKVAVIMAHPDDAEIWVGGTLINHSKNGDEILICYLYPESVNRKNEANKICKYINADVKIIDDDKNHNQLIDILIKYNPTIIITHWSKDSHFEHYDVSKKVFKLIYKLRAIHKIYFTLYECSTYQAIGKNLNDLFQPSIYVDISDVWDEKVKMISEHKSQPIDKLINMTDVYNKFLGTQIATTYAEGFVQVPVLGVLKQNNKLLLGYDN